MNKTNYAIKLDSSCEAVLHFDANLIGFFPRELEQILAKTYDILYPALKGTIVIPINTSVNTGAKSYTFQTWDAVGMARIISDYSQELPRVDVTGTETTAKIRGIGASFGYSFQEIRSAQMVGGTPLEQRRANAARKANDQTVNRIAWAGDAEYGLYGFLTYPNVPVSDVLNDGTGATTQWANKTPTQILRDMTAAVQDVIVNTKGVHTPNTLLLPLDQYSYIARTPYNVYSADTILDFFKSNNPEVNVIWVNELKGAGTAGVNVMIAYEKNPDNLGLIIPQTFETFPPQAKGLEIEISVHSRCGGVVFFYPLSAQIKEGI